MVITVITLLLIVRSYNIFDLYCDYRLGQAASELSQGDMEVLATECGGCTKVELTEVSMTSILNSSIRIEVVSSPSDGVNIDTAPIESLDVLGTVEFSLNSIVLSPQPELFAVSPLLDVSGNEIDGTLVDFSMFLEETLLVNLLFASVIAIRFYSC